MLYIPLGIGFDMPCLWLSLCVFVFFHMHLKTNSLFLKWAFIHFPLPRIFAFAFIKEYRGKGRKEMLFGWSPKTTHTQDWMSLFHWGQSTDISHAHTHTHTDRLICYLVLFFTYSLTSIRSFSHHIQNSDIISCNFGSCFKMSPHLFSTLGPLCAYFFGPSGHRMTE